MTRKIAIQMDPVASIKPVTDSTLRLGLEAQKRGYKQYYYTPDKLSCLNGDITAVAQRVHWLDDQKNWFELGAEEKIALADMDVVLLRQDPPFDMTYLSTTYLLERIHPKTLVVNNPASVRNHPEKLFPVMYKQFMPPTLITADVKEIDHFRTQYRDIVIKPLYGYAGRSVVHLKPEDDNFQAVMELMFAQGSEPVMVQPFLPEVKTGDRRIILADGEIAGIMGRIPAEHEIRANFRVGGTAAKAEITPKQRAICEALAPELKKEGLIFVGLDVIGDWLTEINITSPTGIPAMNRLYGIQVEATIWDAIEARL
jgi:glutathione synthase